MLMVSATLLTALRPISRALPPIMSSTSLPPIVILPGFGNADVDYKTPFNQPEDKGFVAVLARRGFDDVSIVELPRWEWIRVAGGLFDIDFWFNKQRPESRAYGWYVERARRTILAASKRAGGARVLVIGHSAGGWLARATLGQGAWEVAAQAEGEAYITVNAREAICGLVTLGAPHFPPPAGSPPCATRGALACCDEEMPGAYLANTGSGLIDPSAGIVYVTVAGTAQISDPIPPIPTHPSSTCPNLPIRSDHPFGASLEPPVRGEEPPPSPPSRAPTPQPPPYHQPHTCTCHVWQVQPSEGTRRVRRETAASTRPTRRCPPASCLRAVCALRPMSSTPSAEKARRPGWLSPTTRRLAGTARRWAME